MVRGLWHASFYVLIEILSLTSDVEMQTSTNCESPRSDASSARGKTSRPSLDQICESPIEVSDPIFNGAHASGDISPDMGQQQGRTAPNEAQRSGTANEEILLFYTSYCE